MDRFDGDIAKVWDENAPEWIRLSRAGFDVYRDCQNTPQFLQNLPDINGLKGIDIGCGEGTNTAKLAALGAYVHGIDISSIMIDAAQNAFLDIAFTTADASALPFPDQSFDYATAFMAMMDVPKPESAICEVARILKPGGFFQFSILHPCFVPPARKNIRNQDGETVAIEISDYFSKPDGRIEEWSFTDAKRAGVKIEREFQIPRFHRTLSDWINALIENGLQIEHIHEPTASKEQAEQFPTLADTRLAPIFLHIRARKS